MKVESSKYSYQKKGLNHFLYSYNDFLASLLKRDSSQLKYVASPLLGRLEGQTKFYEKLVKFLELKKLLESNSEAKVHVNSMDWVIFRGLSESFPGRVVLEGEVEKALRKQFFVKFLFWMLVSYIQYFYSLLFERTKKTYEMTIRSYFVPRSISKVDGVIRDEYLSQLSADLALNFKSLIVFNVVDWRDLKLYFTCKKSEKFDSVLLFKFLSPFSLFKVFKNLLNSKIQYNEKIIFDGVDISSLLNDALLDEYYSLRSFFYLLESEVAAKVINKTETAIYWPYENQCWEKAYPLAKEMSQSNVMLRGVQHTGISYKLLNYFPSKLDFENYFFPDEIYSVGKIIDEVFKDWGWGKVDLKVGGAIRHTHFNGVKIVSREKSEKVIVYAFSYDIRLYSTVIKRLVNSFQGGDCTIILRYHPLYKRSVVRSYFDFDFELPENFDDNMVESWDQVYNKASIILYDDNTIGLEGLIKGIRTFYFVDSDPFYDSTRLYNLSDIKTEVKSKDFKDDDFFKKHSLFNEEIAQSYIEKYFKIYEKGEGWKEFV